MADHGLVQATACAIVDKLNSGEVTPFDLLDVLEARIAEVDGKVNALPTLCFDRARTHAKELMKKPADQRGLLAGLPELSLSTMAPVSAKRAAAFRVIAATSGSTGVMPRSGE